MNKKTQKTIGDYVAEEVKSMEELYSYFIKDKKFKKDALNLAIHDTMVKGIISRMALEEFDRLHKGEVSE